MKRTMLFAAGFALSASVAASTMVFADQTMVSKIDVDAELSDMENANALEFWPNIEADLEKAILAHAEDRLSDKGYELSVEVREISLSGSTVLTGEGEFNHLEGWVYFREPGNPVPVEQDAIVIDAMTGEVGAAPIGQEIVAVILPGVPDFYAALLHGFGKVTMERLDTLAADPSLIEENRSASDG